MPERPAADRPPLRSALRRIVPASVAGAASTLLGVASVTRLGIVAAVAIVAYFAFVVPSELAVLLTVSMVGAALAGLAPLAVVYAVVRMPV